MDWFKFWGSEFLDDLDLKFNDFTSDDIACWLVLLSYVSRSDTPGMVKHLTEAKLVTKAKVRSCEHSILDRFAQLGMIIIHDNAIEVINWNKKQEKSLTGYERIKRYRTRRDNDEITDDNDDNEVSKSDNAREDKIREDKIILPEWLNKKAWEAWVQHRKEIKKKLTPKTMELQLRFLERNKLDHTNILGRSITNGWTGLFDLPKQGNDVSRAQNKFQREKQDKQDRELAAKDNDDLRKVNDMRSQLNNSKKI